MVLIAGILAILGILALSLEAFSNSATAGAVVRSAAESARRAAESGMGYAAARLAENPYPVRTPGDDWTARGSEPADTPPSRLLNPSYARGDPWTDDNPDGLFDPVGIPPDGWTDADGDGRFTVRSGRLRGACGGEAFFLRIRSPSAKIPVNVGILSPPDHNKPLVAANKPLRNLLNALGAVIFDHLEVPGREDKPAGAPIQGEPIRLSKLGDHLIAARPAGGYEDLDQVRKALATAGYPKAMQEELLPFLTPFIGDRPEQGGIFVPSVGGGYCEPALDAVSVPHEILQALWLYQVVTNPFPMPGNALTTVPFGTAGERAGGNASLTYASVNQMMIYPDESAALADWFVTYRRHASPLSWRGMREDLIGSAQTIFQKEFAQLAAKNAATAAAWVRAKADLAFFAMTLDLPSFHGHSGWGYWGIAHGYPASSVPAFAGPFAGFNPPLTSSRVEEPPWAPVPPTGFSNDPYKAPPASGSAFFPTLTIAPPTHFDVEASGVARGGRDVPQAVSVASGTFATAERIAFTSQEDFENLEGGAGLLSNRGIEVFPPVSGWSRPMVPDGPYRYPMVASLPIWNLRGIPSAQKYSRRHGALELAARAFGPEGAQQYWPILEDYDAGLLDPYEEFKSEAIAPHPTVGLTSPPAWTPSGDTFSFVTPLIPHLPGMTPGAAVETTISFWARGASGILITLSGGASAIAVSLGESFDVSTGMPEVTAELSVGDWPTGSGFDSFDATGKFPIYSQMKDEIVPDWHFAALTIRPAGGQSEFRLFLDGDLFLPPIVTNGPEFHGAGPVKIHALDVDELRFHQGALTQDEILAIYRKGRYVHPDASLPAVYTSPRYVLGPGSRLLRAGWLGLPSGEPPAKDHVAIDVKVRGYDAAGTEILSSPLGPDGRVTPLFAHASVSSFDYVVEFTGDGSGEPVYRSPRFESIWLQFQRRRRTGWLSWGAPAGGFAGGAGGGGAGGGGPPPPGGGPPGGGPPGGGGPGGGGIGGG